jgi:transketolase
MRREFVNWLESAAGTNPRLLLLTGDLGFDAFEGLQKMMGARFINVGVSEQNMISVAAGLAQQGLDPLCYSIAPFAVFRAYEQIRLDLALHNMNVKIVGNGGGYGYGIMGATHHALEDLAVMSVLPNFRCVVPLCNSDVAAACDWLIAVDGPAYLRLGFGHWPEDHEPLADFNPIRKIAGIMGRAARLTIVGIGPVLLNALPAVRDRLEIDVFAVSQIPLFRTIVPLAESLNQSRNLMVIEEHAVRGGLGEYLTTELLKAGVSFRLVHHYAAGYPGGVYGSQAYHQNVSNLDTASLTASIEQILRS